MSATPSVDFTTVQNFREQSRLDLDEDATDEALEKIIRRASVTIWDYLEGTDLIYTNDSPRLIHPVIETATLLVAAEMYENREANNSNLLSDYVVLLLRRFRFPAMA